MPKYKIGKGGKMEAIPDAVKPENSSDKFDALAKEIAGAPSQSNKESDEIGMMNQTLETMQQSEKPKGFFGTKVQPQKPSIEMKDQELIMEEEFEEMTQQPQQQRQQPQMQQQMYQQPQQAQQPSQQEMYQRFLQQQQQEAMRQQQMFLQQQEVMRQQQMQQQRQRPSPVTVTIMMVENDKITVPLDSSNIDGFIEELNSSMVEGSIFKIDNITLNCKKIKYYNIE